MYYIQSLMMSLIARRARPSLKARSPGWMSVDVSMSECIAAKTPSGVGSGMPFPQPTKIGMAWKKRWGSDGFGDRNRGHCCCAVRLSMLKLYRPGCQPANRSQTPWMRHSIDSDALAEIRMTFGLKP